MFRRVYSVLATFGGGSLRKRLYIRLAIVAVLLSFGIWGIAQMQRATRDKKQDDKQLAAKAPSKTSPAKKSAPSSRRVPQPVPGQHNARAVIGDDSDSEDQDTSDGATGETGSYSYDPSTASSGDSYSYGSSKYGSEKESEQVATVADTESELADDESSAASEAASDDSSYTLSDDSAAEESSESDEISTSEEATTAESDVEAAASELAQSEDTSDEPGRLLIPTGNESAADEAELGTEDASSTLAAVPQQGATLQPIRSANAESDLTSATSRTAPTLVNKGGRSAPLSSVASAAGSNETASVALPPAPGLDENSPELEGLQLQSVTIEKTAPDEVQVGRPATFEIYVRNVGQATARNVVVTDRVPQGAVLNETSPQADVASGVLTWNLGTMESNAEARLTMTVTPQVEGYIGSSAQVTFAAQAAARTISTKPELKVEIDAPAEVLIGDFVDLLIRIRNDGTGQARGVVIEADIPEGLTHQQGRELEQALGTIHPGEVRPIKLVLSADRAGAVSNVVRVRDDGSVDLSETANINIVAPKLAVGIEGPRLRYLERQATYDFAVQNVGTAVAKNVELIVRLPTNLQFVSADKLGQYDVQQHAVFWNLEELPPQKTGSVRLVTLPIQEGNRELRVEAFGDLADTAEARKDVTVESVPELTFSISDTADPIEVGSDTIYEIEVVNQGSKADKNIVVAMEFPEELSPVKGEGPTRAQVSGQQIQFDPLSQLAAGDSVIYRVQAQGRVAGDPRILVQLTSEQMPKPVSKEESTKVYSD